MTQQTRSFASLFSGHSFTATAIQLILDNPIEGETASNRMKQIGFLCFVHQLQVAGMDTTVSQIMSLIGQKRAHIVEFVAPLKKRNLLVEHTVRNAAGRVETKLTVPPDILRRVMPIA